MRTRLVAAGAALVLAGGGMLVFPLTSHAEDTGFGSFSLSAEAPGIHVIFDTQQAPAHPAGEGAFPKAYSSLEAGPIGYGLASVAWPGPLAGNLGSLAVVSGAPQQAAVLNDSVKAESHAPGGPPDATYEQPGVSMQSHADPQLVTANASVTKTASGTAFSVGNVDGASKVALAGAKGTAEGTSVVSNFSIGDGVLKIGSIVSVARAATDGNAATGEGHTTVTGVTVAGQPASIDETGLHIGNQNQPDPVAGAANQVGAEALRQAGITVTVSQPQKTVQGATGQLTAGSVVVNWNDGHGEVTTFALGGASASVAATPGFGTADLTGNAPVPVASGDTGSAAETATGGPAPEVSDAGTTPAATSGSGSGSGRGGSQVAVTPAAASSPAGFFHGLAPALIVMAIGASFIVAGTLKRLADDVLTRSSSSCNLEES